MSASWRFTKAKPGDRARESQVEKFFHSDAVANRSEAIVREGIQNSLDAAPTGARVRVRIKLGAWTDEDRFVRLALYARDFDKHLAAARGQDSARRAGRMDDFRFLAFEDFGTTGLLGDETEWWPDSDSPPNPFSDFFRSEGVSGKSAGSRGRHGVGRLVFMFASSLRMMFGLTRRDCSQGTEELLMGTAVLRNHRMDGQPFLPDAWFGEPDLQLNELTLPVRDEQFVGQFKRDFDLARGAENGLSIVVPWLSRDVESADIVFAVIADYFYPILRKELVVTVVDVAGKEQTISDTTIDALVAESPSLSSLAAVVRLARASLAVGEAVIVSSPPYPQPLTWDASSIAPEEVEAMKAALEAGELVAVSVLTRVVPRGRTPLPCQFEVYFQRDASAGDGELHFIREGITIPGMRVRGTVGVRALVVIYEGPLATFLGDSENPSHTQWQRGLVKSAYSGASELIDFVVRSVPALLAKIGKQSSKPDATLLIDLFSVPARNVTPLKQKQERGLRKGRKETHRQDLKPPTKPRRFAIAAVSGGFVVRQGQPGADRPRILAVKVAYGVRRGSPFARYNPSDFRLGIDGIEAFTTGCEVVEQGDNCLTLRVTEAEFELRVVGFDTDRRDLHVDARVTEQLDRANPDGGRT